MEAAPSAPFWIRPAGWIFRHLPRGRYRAMNSWSNAMLRLGLANKAFVAKSPNHDAPFRYVCNLQDSIQRDVCFMGKYEPQETALLRHFLKTPGLFVDVGANWGYFTLLAASLCGNTGKVVSFEPDPRLFELLTRNVALNKFQNVTLCQTAAADRESELVLEGYDAAHENWGISKLVGSPPQGKSAFNVRARAVDDVLDELGHESVDLLKMDIEGAEDLALKGMQRRLSKHKYAVILVELHPALLAEKNASPLKAIEPLLNNGYRGWRVRHSFEDTRSAAYKQHLNVSDLLEPWNKEMQFDSWPHMVWLAPGRNLD